MMDRSSTAKALVFEGGIVRGVAAADARRVVRLGASAGANGETCTCLLPNGLLLDAINRVDTQVLFHEVFEADAYWRDLVPPRRGDVVFDVGANIGLFSLALDQRFDGLQVHAFEPIPRVHDALARNAARCRNVAVTPHAFGLSCADRRERFTFDPFLSYAGSSHLGELHRLLPRSLGGRRRDKFAPSRWVAALLDEVVMTGLVEEGEVVRTLRRLLERRAGRAALVAAWLALFAALLARRALFLSRVDAEVRTLSRVKRELGVARIALLKVDVEGAELDVLRGVDDADWAAIDQVLAEVHDVDGRVAQIRALLEGHGFRVAVEPDARPLLRLLRIFKVHARRVA